MHLNRSCSSRPLPSISLPSRSTAIDV
jgi:hypothetical protein